MFTVTKQFKQGTAVVTLSLENQGNVKVALEAIDQAAAEADLKAGASRAKATKKNDTPTTTTDATVAPAPEPTANALAGAVPAAPVPTPAAPAVPAPTPAAPVAPAPATANPVATPQVQMEQPAPATPVIPQAEAAADPMAAQWRQAFRTMVDNVKAITPENVGKLEAAAVAAMGGLNVQVSGLDHAVQVLEGFGMEHVKPFYDYVAQQVTADYPNHQ